MLDTELPVYVLTSTGATAGLLRRAFPASLRITAFSSPLEALAACVDRPPVLLVVELLNQHETWLPALQVLSESVPDAPRRLFLAEPALLEDLLHDVFERGTDHLQLWPCDPSDLQAAVTHMLRPEAGTPATDAMAL